MPSTPAPGTRDTSWLPLREFPKLFAAASQATLHPIPPHHRCFTLGALWSWPIGIVTLGASKIRQQSEGSERSNFLPFVDIILIDHILVNAKLIHQFDGSPSSTSCLAKVGQDLPRISSKLSTPSWRAS